MRDGAPRHKMLGAVRRRGRRGEARHAEVWNRTPMSPGARAAGDGCLPRGPAVLLASAEPPLAAEGQAWREARLPRCRCGSDPGSPNGGPGDFRRALVQAPQHGRVDGEDRADIGRHLRQEVGQALLVLVPVERFRLQVLEGPVRCVARLAEQLGVVPRDFQEVVHYIVTEELVGHARELVDYVQRCAGTPWREPRGHRGEILAGARAIRDASVDVRRRFAGHVRRRTGAARRREPPDALPEVLALLVPNESAPVTRTGAIEDPAPPRTRTYDGGEDEYHMRHHGAF
mmetsp:Transcript_118265/g.331228  ORF Transcript_118265/g.331228 Transcript_118265/m.331228 type:complete len:287 (+) Transcript_118265:365-1225(+)